MADRRRDDSAPMPPTARPRLASLDAYRGLAMLLMMAEALDLRRVARSFPGSPAWRWLADQQSHVEWSGCSLHDLIQPSFTFLVGASLPFSLAKRRRAGESTGRIVAHACWRGLVLVALGIGLRSIGRDRTNFTFEDTLSQIGLGYPALALIGLARPRWYPLALALILVATWGAFALGPGPPPDFDYPAVAVPADWPHHASGFASRWNKNSNLAWKFDRWWLDRFPRETRFRANAGGYATLSFVPTLGTMVLGLIAGVRLIGAGGGWRSARWLGGVGLTSLLAGLGVEALGLCPIVKRIWTPTWVLFSGGICLMTLAAWHAVVDVEAWRRWTYPLAVLGRNSIAAYCLAHLVGDFVLEACRTRLGRGVFESWGAPYAPILEGSAVVLAIWLILLWMDRRRIYLKV